MSNAQLWSQSYRQENGRNFVWGKPAAYRSEPAPGHQADNGAVDGRNDPSRDRRSRVGAAQDLGARGYDLGAIQQAGGWESREAMLKYIEHINAKQGGAAAASSRR